MSRFIIAITGNRVRRALSGPTLHPCPVPSRTNPHPRLTLGRPVSTRVPTGDTDGNFAKVIERIKKAEAPALDVRLMTALQVLQVLHAKSERPDYFRTAATIRMQTN